MATDSVDFRIDDLELPESYLRLTAEGHIRRSRARTANILAIILVVGLVVALPAYALAISLLPAASDKLAAVFDKWFTIISPLVGTALGAYDGSRLDHNDRHGGSS